jgi:hypothetical protein
MGQREKLLEEIRDNPTNVRFEDIDRLLRMYGYTTRPHGGSHYYYKRKGCPPISVPRARPLKEVYVKRAIEAIEICAEGQGE